VYRPLCLLQHEFKAHGKFGSTLLEGRFQVRISFSPFVSSICATDEASALKSATITRARLSLFESPSPSPASPDVCNYCIVSLGDLASHFIARSSCLPVLELDLRLSSFISQQFCACCSFCFELPLYIYLYAVRIKCISFGIKQLCTCLLIPFQDLFQLGLSVIHIYTVRVN